MPTPVLLKKTLGILFKYFRSLHSCLNPLNPLFFFLPITSAHHPRIQLCAMSAMPVPQDKRNQILKVIFVSLLLDLVPGFRADY